MQTCRHSVLLFLNKSRVVGASPRGYYEFRKEKYLIFYSSILQDRRQTNLSCLRVKIHCRSCQRRLDIGLLMTVIMKSGQARGPVTGSH